MNIPVALQKEYMGVVWWILFAVLLIVHRIYPIWPVKVLAGMAFIIGLIYMKSSITSTIKYMRRKNELQQQSESDSKDEQGPRKPGA